MSAPEVTRRLVEALNSRQYDVAIRNYANPDMVGHTGNFVAAVQALEAVDKCLGEVITALRQLGGEMVLIADHGNAEQKRLTP